MARLDSDLLRSVAQYADLPTLITMVRSSHTLHDTAKYYYELAAQRDKMRKCHVEIVKRVLGKEEPVNINCDSFLIESQMVSNGDDEIEMAVERDMCLRTGRWHVKNRWKRKRSLCGSALYARKKYGPDMLDRAMMVTEHDPRFLRPVPRPRHNDVQKIAVCYVVTGDNYGATVIVEQLVGCDTLSRNYDSARKRGEWQ
jgi:hypothetical protein